MKSSLTVFLFILSATQIWAAGLLGESYDGCVARLGQPSGHERTGELLLPEKWEFETKGWYIAVWFNSGKVLRVQYSRSDGLPISADQMKALDNAYGGGYSWSVENESEGVYVLDFTHELKAKKSMTSVWYWFRDMESHLKK